MHLKTLERIAKIGFWSVLVTAAAANVVVGFLGIETLKPYQPDIEIKRNIANPPHLPQPSLGITLQDPRSGVMYNLNCEGPFYTLPLNGPDSTIEEPDPQDYSIFFCDVTYQNSH